MVAPTVDELTEDIEDAQAAELPDQISGDKLTLHYIANRIWATEVHYCYQLLEDTLETLDILKAEGTYLDALVAHALPAGRLLGSKASGEVTFLADYAPAADITIPAGTRMYSLPELSTDKIWYKTTVEATLAAGETEVTVAVEAEERGIAGNIANYTIIQHEGYIAGISGCENRLDITGGTVDESDDELRQRYWDAIIAPGRSTTLMIERSLADLADVKEVKIVNYGFGDMGIVVDYSGGIAEVSDDIVDCIEENIGGGVQARGCLGATIVGATAVVTTNDAYGGTIWVRPRVHIGAEDTFTMTYLDMDGATQTASITIPAGTHCGDMVAATMVSEASRAKKILTVTPSGNNSYDILIGMGISGRLYNLPELIDVDISAHIYQTDTPETDLLANIEASLEAFIDSLMIGERIEFSDIQRFMFNEFDPDAEDNIGRAFIGIDEISDITISTVDATITQVGERLTIEEDSRFEPGTITVALGA